MRALWPTPLQPEEDGYWALGLSFELAVVYQGGVYKLQTRRLENTLKPKIFNTLLGFGRTKLEKRKKNIILSDPLLLQSPGRIFVASANLVPTFPKIRDTYLRYQRQHHTTNLARLAMKRPQAPSHGEHPNR
ncbi:hypothetical protein Moror_7915 [Moniliophthora roreri MCA 2997]|uniref:Uncharacterized protein n=1 Tax=Moniliophthora roreri (strain MCA 2997) TaxID=1381753 RepID=V2XBY9_MONRO|nr:hypothetical protein Moror_7915 [Moniliophthora roreri MCA 2997]